MPIFFLSDKQIIVYVQRFESSDYGKRLLGKLEWIFFQEAMLGDGRTYPKYFWGQNNTFWRWYSNVYCSISQQDKYTICLLCIVGKMIPQSRPVICNLWGIHWPGSSLHALTHRGSAQWFVGCKRYAKFKLNIFYRHVFHNSWNGVELKSMNVTASEAEKLIQISNLYPSSWFTCWFCWHLCNFWYNFLLNRKLRTKGALKGIHALLESIRPTSVVIQKIVISNHECNNVFLQA